MAELADAQDLGSCGRKALQVQLLSPAPKFPAFPPCCNLYVRVWDGLPIAIIAVWLGWTLLKAALKYGLYKGKFKERSDAASATA